MATQDTFQDYRDAVDDMTALANDIKHSQKVFLDMASTFQGWVQVYEPVFWKVDDDAMREMIGNIERIMEGMRIIIEKEKEDAGIE